MLSSDFQKSEDNLKQVIDTIPTLVWCTGPDGSTEYLNKRWHDYTGFSPEESRVRGWQPTVHPEDLPRVVAKGQELLASGQPGEVEARTLEPCGLHVSPKGTAKLSGHAVWSTAFIRSSFIRPPCTRILERAVSISRRSADVS